MAPAQNIVKQEKKGQDTMDNLIRQAIAKESFLSFSRANDSPFQLIQLLNTFDQQGSGKIGKSTEENCRELKEYSLDHNIDLKSISSKKNGIMEPSYSLKGCGEFTKGSKSTSAMQPLKIPDAVVAFAQAAAKANGDLKNVCQVSKSDISGWPLLSPSKRQLHKCDKCSHEFCSSINYRRHIRVHRRSLNAHMDSQKSRNFLSEFWDKLSVDEAKKLVSLKSVTVEEISGSSVIKALSTWIRRPASLSSLPQMYIKAGLTLLDVVQACPSMFPVSSHELFSVLDNASESTFLCAGTASSVQKYVFDGEAIKNALEIKNLVALTSFLIEKELVRAWLADKDAEALRCQKLLVEEEEYALKRQADILERKRLKKLRQKEQKAKENSSVMKVDSNSPPPDFTKCVGSTECCSPRTLSEDCNSEASINQQSLHSAALPGDDLEAKLRLSMHESNSEKNGNDLGQIANGCSGPDGMTGEKNPRLLFGPEDAEKDIVQQTQRVNCYQQQNHVRSFYAKSIKNSLNGSRAGNVLAVRSSNLRHNNRDPKSVIPGNGHKVWTIKFRPDNEEDCKSSRCFADGGPRDQIIESDISEVLIGSINVTLKNSEGKHPCTILKPQFQEKPLAPDSSLISANRTVVKLWRPVSRNGSDSSLQNDRKDEKPDACATQAAERISADQSFLAFRGTDVDCEKYNAPILFSCEGAKIFLVQRWKEAIAGEHVVVVSPPEAEVSDYPGVLEGCFAKQTSRTADFPRLNILVRAEKGSEFKSVPKQKNIA